MSQVRNKQRLLRLLKYLYEETDEEHQVSTQELVDLFTAEKANAGRKTVKDDIDVLTSEGYDIVTRKGFSNYFFMASREFELPELKLLIDAVSSSRFITREKSERLIGKLSGLASRHEAEQLVRHIYSADRLKAGNTHIYYIVDRITDAINQGRKVEFQYCDYTPSKERVLRHGGDSYVVSPYSLLWDDNHYYMVGYYDRRSAVNVFRVDRMETLSVLREDAVDAPEDFCIKDWAQQVFNMFTGEHRSVVLECENDMMKSIIDQFGEEVETWVVDESHFRVRAEVCTSQTFYGWIFQFAGRIRPVEPEPVVAEYREMLGKAMEGLG